MFIHVAESETFFLNRLSSVKGIAVARGGEWGANSPCNSFGIRLFVRLGNGNGPYLYILYVTVPGGRERMCENNPDYTVDPDRGCGSDQPAVQPGSADVSITLKNGFGVAALPPKFG